MGWNTLKIIKDTALTKNVVNHSYSYFVHSYALSVTEHTCAIMQHGKDFSAIVQYQNFYGTQFHPERSGDTGKTILSNFLEL
jgi:glutamine amidotransferase